VIDKKYDFTSCKCIFFLCYKNGGFVVLFKIDIVLLLQEHQKY